VLFIYNKEGGLTMAVMRVHKTKDYTVMSNYHFKERGMSLKAKGLLSLMISLPDDWDYSIAGLATLSRDGKDSVMGALNELEKFGYLIRTKCIDEKGRFAGYDYDIYEKPNTETPKEETPYAEKPNTENQAQLNTNQSTTNLSIIKKSNTNKGARFVKPTLEEVKAYCTERGNNVDAEHFYDYYEANGWRVGKNPMKDWKASVRTWERNGYDGKAKTKTHTQAPTIMDDYRAMEERINKKGLFG
jgi:hypothetical protein